YFQNVKVTSSDGRQKFSFQGVIKKTPEEVEVLGLSYFGSPMFRLKQNLRSKQKEIEIEFSENRMAQYRPEIERYYSFLQPVLFLLKDSPHKSRKAGFEWAGKNISGFPS